MNGSSKPSSERLYLQRDEDDEIFVDSVLHQHHIDGIRFLYKQYKKKRAGVIINNPLGYGNSMQVALFLGAIRHTLDKPILILCEQSEELNWLEHFQKLTQCYNVGVGAPSPFVKKSIFINTMERLEQFCRRDWGAMVVVNDSFLKEKALQAKFKVDFKIWITPVDMKDNLQTFSSIHKWIFPDEKLNIEDFTAKPGSLADAVSKAILLDAYLDDIVCRTTLQTPFENPFDKSDSTEKKSSKKNKDATGTKAKRSKRPLETPSTSSSMNNSNTEAGGSTAKIPRTDNTTGDDSTVSNDEDTRKSDVDDDKSDVESFIRNKKPIKFDPFNEFDNISHTSQESREFMDDEPLFDTADRLNRLLESNVPMDIAENPEFCFIDSDTNSDSLLPITKAHDDTSQHSNNSDYKGIKRTTPDFLSDKLLNDIDTFKENVEDDCAKFDEVSDIDKQENLKGDTKENQESCDKIEEKPDTVKDMSNNIIKDSGDNEGDISDAKDDSGVVKNEPCNDKKESDKVKESPSKYSLDDKFKEMEERALKKFQGSILDSLF